MQQTATSTERSSAEAVVPQSRSSAAGKTTKTRNAVPQREPEPWTEGTKFRGELRNPIGPRTKQHFMPIGAMLPMDVPNCLPWTFQIVHGTISCRRTSRIGHGSKAADGTKFRRTGAGNLEVSSFPDETKYRIAL
jgi:hypothetical protein